MTSRAQQHRQHLRDNDEYLLSPVQVLGSALALEYDPSRGATVSVGNGLQALVCAKSNHTIAPPLPANEPAYTKPASAFRGTSSFTSSVAGTDGLRSSAAHGSDLIPAGSRPYLAWLGRLLTGTGAPTEFLVTLCAGTGVTPVDFGLLRTQGGPPYFLNAVVNGGVRFALQPTIGAHLVELVYNGTTLEIWLDNVLAASQVAEAAVTNAIRRVAIGQRFDDLRWASAEHGYVVAATSITPAQRAALIPHWQSRGAPI